MRSKIMVPADPIIQGIFNKMYFFPVITNKILAVKETFPRVENMKKSKLNPSVDLSR
jgi:hypothetical protein